MVYPWLQLVDFNTPSWQFNAEVSTLGKRTLLEFVSNYLFGDWSHYDVLFANNHTSSDAKRSLATRLRLDALPDDEIKQLYRPQSIQEGDSVFWNKHQHLFTDPYLNPLMADSLRGLPPAVISSCQYDVLRDDSYFYAGRLHEANVSVEHLPLDPCFHGWIMFQKEIKQFNYYYENILHSIQRYI